MFETEHIGDADLADVRNGTQCAGVVSSYITGAVARLANGKLDMLNLNIKKMIGSYIVWITYNVAPFYPIHRKQKLILLTSVNHFVLPV